MGGEDCEEEEDESEEGNEDEEIETMGGAEKPLLLEGVGVEE